MTAARSRPIGDRIRQILLSSENSRMEPATEFFLYVAARAQHIAEIVERHGGFGMLRGQYLVLDIQGNSM